MSERTYFHPDTVFLLDEHLWVAGQSFEVQSRMTVYPKDNWLVGITLLPGDIVTYKGCTTVLPAGARRRWNQPPLRRFFEFNGEVYETTERFVLDHLDWLEAA